MGIIRQLGFLLATVPALALTDGAPDEQTSVANHTDTAALITYPNIMEEVIVTAPYPYAMIMEEVIVTAPHPYPMIMEEVIVTAPYPYPVILDEVIVSLPRPDSTLVAFLTERADRISGESAIVTSH